MNKAKYEALVAAAKRLKFEPIQRDVCDAITKALALPDEPETSLTPRSLFERSIEQHEINTDLLRQIAANTARSAEETHRQASIQSEMLANRASVAKLFERMTLHTQPCVICGKPACVVEECPIETHKKSCQMTDGSWVCSQECWDAFADAFDEKPSIEPATNPVAEPEHVRMMPVGEDATIEPEMDNNKWPKSLRDVLKAISPCACGRVDVGAYWNNLWNNLGIAAARMNADKAEIARLRKDYEKDYEILTARLDLADTLADEHKAALAAKDAEVARLNGLYNSACRQVDNLAAILKEKDQLVTEWENRRRELQSQFSFVTGQRDELREQLTAKDAEIKGLELYRQEYAKVVAGVMWMHDDQTLGVCLGNNLLIDGVAALRKQRDELRVQLAAATDPAREKWIGAMESYINECAAGRGHTGLLSRDIVALKPGGKDGAA